MWERELASLQAKAYKLSENTICEKKDLEWPVKFIRMRVGWIIRNWWHIEVVHRFQELLARLRRKPAHVSHLEGK